MAAKLYYQEDCNLSVLEGQTIAIIGYGSQGLQCIKMILSRTWKKETC